MVSTRILGAVSAAFMAFALLTLPACEEKKPPEKEAPKVKVEQPEKLAAQPQPVEEPTPKPLVKAPVEAKPVEPAPPVVKEPTPADKLAVIMGKIPDTKATGEVTVAFLTELSSFRKAHADTPEAKAALVTEAALKSSVALRGLGAGAEAATRVMVMDGALAEGATVTPETASAWYRKLAGEAQAAAESAEPPMAARLSSMAALLAFLADDTLEQAGVNPGNQVILPASWTATPNPEERPAVANVEKVEKKEGTATEAAPATPEVPVLQKGGVDISTLYALMNADSPVAREATLVALLKAKKGLSMGTSSAFGERWMQMADGLGKMACESCGAMASLPKKFRGKVLLMKENRGIVCEAAAAAYGPETDPKALLKEHCAASFGLGEAEFLTPINAVVLRVIQVVTQLIQSAPTQGDETLDPELAALRTEVGALLGASVGLVPPMMGLPPEKWEEMKDSLVLASNLSPESPCFSYQPLELMLVDEKGVSSAMRPVVPAIATAPSFLESQSGYHFPGKQFATVESIEQELKDKEAKLKEAKATWSDRFKAYMQEVVIKGVKFDKPDYSIPSVVEEARALSDVAAGMEGGTFAWLAGEKIINSERGQWENFSDTIGKSALFGIDAMTPALLFKRVLDSFYYADFKDDRLVKGSGCAATIPTVYYTEKFVDDSVVDTTYKRPVLVYITEGEVIRFYPPAERSTYSHMTAKRSPAKRNSKWPRSKGTEVTDPRIPDEIWNTFMVYTNTKVKDWPQQVSDIALEMKTKWDNGNVFYVMADDKAPSWLVVQVADLLSRLPGSPMTEMGKAWPGMVCDAEKEPERCLTNIVVLFPEVEIPYLPGKKKVQEVQQNVYCDNKDIAMRIKKKYGAFRYCYEGELQKNRNLQGKVVFRFTIGADGRVTAISVAGDQLGNQNVVRCSMNVIKGIQFKRPIGGECVIQHPYLFKP